MMLNNLKDIFADRVFTVSLGLSTAIHLLILVEVHTTNLTNSKSLPRIIYGKLYEPQRETKFEYVSGQKLKDYKERISIDNKFSIPHPTLPKPKDIVENDGFDGMSSVSPTSHQIGKVEILSPQSAEDMLFKKVIVAQAIPKSPQVRQKYIDYYEKIREKIRNSAYKLFRSGVGSGDVYISFELDNKGNLLEAHIVKEKSSGGMFLYDIAIKSLKEAAPFGKFPPQLVHKKLRFNVIISFRR